MMHDVNIEEMTSFVTLLTIKLTLHLWSKLHPDQPDRLGFEIQDAWKSAKKKLSHSTDHIMVDQCRADPTLVIIMIHDEILKKRQSKMTGFSLVTLL